MPNKKKRENFGMKLTRKQEAGLRSGKYNSYSVPRSKINVGLDKMMSGFKKGVSSMTPGAAANYQRPVKTHKRVTVEKGSYLDKIYKEKEYSQYKLSKRKVSNKRNIKKGPSVTRKPKMLRNKRKNYA
tara:strand:- start:2491 stop:2874 length:384 start_codon:yes stop_codon:yes gene_type:complete